MTWVAALLFAVHPIHTEAVASIVGRSQLLAVHFHWARGCCTCRIRPIPALLCFVLALMAKESAVAPAAAGDCRGIMPRQTEATSSLWLDGRRSGMLLHGRALENAGRPVQRKRKWFDRQSSRLPSPGLRILNALRVRGSTLPCTFIRPRFPATIPITRFFSTPIGGTHCPRPSPLPLCWHFGSGPSGRSERNGSWRGNLSGGLCGYSKHSRCDRNDYG